MAENIADNILLRIVEETTKHNDNITKQMSADRELLGKLISANELRDAKQDEQDKTTAEHEGIQTHFSSHSQHKLSNIDEDMDERPDLQTGADDTRTDAILSEMVGLLTKALGGSQKDIKDEINKKGDEEISVSKEILEDSKAAKKDQKEALEILNETAEKTFGATVAAWSKQGKQWIDDNSQFSKMWGNLTSDFQILFGKMSMLQNVPGWKSITGFIKFAIAWMGKLLLTKLFAKFPDQMESLVKRFEDFQVAIGKRTSKEIGEARKKRAKLSKERKEATEALKPKPGEDAPGILKAARDRVGEMGTEGLFEGKGRKRGKSAWRTGRDAGREGSDKRTKTGRKTSKQFKGMTKSMGTMGKVMANLGRALSIVTGVISTAVSGFVAAMTATGAVIAGVTVPVWGIVAVVIIVIALVAALIYWMYLKWDEINDWWDRMKVHLAAAMERMMLWKDKAVNWFSDMGTRLGFMIRRIIAVMLDGIAGALNHAIELFNAIPLVPDVDWRMETGRVEAVDEERAAFEVEAKKRGEELERRGTELAKAKDEKMDEVLRQQGGGGVNQQINNSSTTKKEVDISVNTRPSDPYANSLVANNV